VDDRELRRLMLPELQPSMAAHIDRVVDLADRLARRHNLDVARVRLAAQGHDLLRLVSPSELLARAEARGMEIDPVERAAPVILHGPLGALELEERFGVDDYDVLEAIRWHTVGHPEFSSEAWAMFIADKTEPSKVERAPTLGGVLDLADESLEVAALAYFDLRFDEAIRLSQQQHPISKLTRDALVASCRTS
tara:strand:+ start:2718 stop:3296 length:579 start_codon:yes stop_codon:yes gene_type:complete